MPTPTPAIPRAIAPPSALALMVAESSAETVTPLLSTELLFLIESRDQVRDRVESQRRPRRRRPLMYRLEHRRDGERRSDAKRIDAGRLDGLDDAPIPRP